MAYVEASQSFFKRGMSTRHELDQTEEDIHGDAVLDDGWDGSGILETAASVRPNMPAYAGGRNSPVHVTWNEMMQ